jgi:hypothetical protein
MIVENKAAKEKARIMLILELLLLFRLDDRHIKVLRRSSCRFLMRMMFVCPFLGHYAIPVPFAAPIASNPGGNDVSSLTLRSLLLLIHDFSWLIL